MKAHDLANLLLSGDNLDIVIDGYEDGVGRFSKEAIIKTKIKPYNHAYRDDRNNSLFQYKLDNFPEGLLPEDGTEITVIYIQRNVTSKDRQIPYFESHDYYGAHKVMEDDNYDPIEVV